MKERYCHLYNWSDTSALYIHTSSSRLRFIFQNICAVTHTHRHKTYTCCWLIHNNSEIYVFKVNTHKVDTQHITLKRGEGSCVSKCINVYQCDISSCLMRSAYWARESLCHSSPRSVDTNSQMNTMSAHHSSHMVHSEQHVWSVKIAIEINAPLEALNHVPPLQVKMKNEITVTSPPVHLNSHHQCSSASDSIDDASGRAVIPTQLIAQQLTVTSIRWWDSVERRAVERVLFNVPTDISLEANFRIMYLPMKKDSIDVRDCVMTHEDWGGLSVRSSATREHHYPVASILRKLINSTSQSNRLSFILELVWVRTAASSGIGFQRNLLIVQSVCIERPSHTRHTRERVFLIRVQREDHLDERDNAETSAATRDRVAQWMIILELQRKRLVKSYRSNMLPSKHSTVQERRVICRK